MRKGSEKICKNLEKPIKNSYKTGKTKIILKKNENKIPENLKKKTGKNNRKIRQKLSIFFL